MRGVALLASVLVLACGDAGSPAAPGDGAAVPAGGDATVPGGDAGDAEDAHDGASGDEPGPGGTDGGGGGETGGDPDVPGDASGDAPGPGAECPLGMHFEGPICVADVCQKGLATCADPKTAKHCAEDGSAFDLLPCPEGHVCFGGACWEPVCEPGEVLGCQGAAVLQCNSTGLDTVSFPCPGGEACQAGACVPITANVLFLVDTSGSMNWLDGGAEPGSCAGASCPPWSFPHCDDADPPETRLGKVKAALRAVLETEQAAGLRVALQRFPQSPFSWTDGFFGQAAPACEGGLWGLDPWNQAGTMTGDVGEHETAPAAWFDLHLAQVLPVPFGIEPTAADPVLRWIDGVEAVAPAVSPCASGGSCPDVAGVPAACLESGCHPIEDPELRGLGATPLGKSLFYAGEHFRHHVLVEGKPCASDLDCGSAHHACVDGLCHDPVAYCRQNVVILFTDGEETEHVHLDDFFHPRVQAKRLHYGLGCSGDADCLSGATCKKGICEPKPGTIPNMPVCETGELPCENVLDCPDVCAAWGSCQAWCNDSVVKFQDPQGKDRLHDHAGVPVALTVHVVDTSGVPGKNQLIAKYGGGQHWSVDLAEPEALLGTLTAILGDAKGQKSCGGSP